MAESRLRAREVKSPHAYKYVVEHLWINLLDLGDMRFKFLSPVLECLRVMRSEIFHIQYLQG
ncbi:MAG: hypothetical protein Greene041662_684 [Candidatus Peregrinibacteria bacterium Greene0416_62]|nr:MAG: hypothetical protein Greene041662_684 [Candidatus Peregrinibacteria bacterium Greene0416_62]